MTTEQRNDQILLQQKLCCLYSNGKLTYFTLFFTRDLLLQNSSFDRLQVCMLVYVSRSRLRPIKELARLIPKRLREVVDRDIYTHCFHSNRN
jgi:hypothetical protein